MSEAPQTTVADDDAPADERAPAWHTLSVDEAADRLETDLETGLSEEEAEARQAVVVYWGPLQRGFETVALSPGDWLLATGVASSVIVASEILKRTPLLRKD